MPDFLNLDPEIITKFWVHIAWSFTAGLFFGWSARVVLTKIASDNFSSEKKKFEAERDSLMKIKEDHDALSKDLEKNDEYWLYKRQTSGESDSDIDPSNLLHDGLKKKK